MLGEVGWGGGGGGVGGGGGGEGGGGYASLQTTLLKMKSLNETETLLFFLSFQCVEGQPL